MVNFSPIPRFIIQKLVDDNRVVQIEDSTLFREFELFSKFDRSHVDVVVKFSGVCFDGDVVALVPAVLLEWGDFWYGGDS